MTISANIHGAKRITHDRKIHTSWFTIETDDGYATATVFTPRHVAEATAAAFNRAMQVKQKNDGFVYANDAGLWNISVSHGPWTVWHAQHDEITGDGDPPWMRADARTLEELQDALDDIAVERKEDAA